MFILTYEDKNNKFYEKIETETKANDQFNYIQFIRLWNKVILEEIHNDFVEMYIDYLEKEGYTNINK